MEMSNNTFIELRKFIRLKSVFPVDFSFIVPILESQNINWQQSYTSNVSKGGLCIETTRIEKNDNEEITKGALVRLRLHIYFSLKPVEAIAEIKWIRKVDFHGIDKYLIGLQYKKIDERVLAKIMNRVQWMRISPKVAIITTAILFLLFLSEGIYNYFLRSENIRMVDAFVSMQQKETVSSNKLKRIKAAEVIIKNKIQQMKETNPIRKELQDKYRQIVERERMLEDRLDIISREKIGMQKGVINTMRLWLKNHQSKSTGLIKSFEGNVGVIKDWAFIYDQSLAVCVFLSFDDIDDARKIINFFQRHISENFKGFPNGYYYDSGDVCEFTIHSGPNIWIGIAILQYVNKTGDKYYLPLAEKITDWLITIQDKDPHGGLKGGPNFQWFATEHNLDAYALFNMMYKMTKQNKYKIARDKVLSWLRNYAMNSNSKEYKSPPIKRGKGDSTIATDTYAWSLASIGPKKLYEMNMDAEKIMKFADNFCSVSLDYKRPSGVVVHVKGFDFSKQANTPRGGLISPEWTSQMIISYKILSDYFASEGKLFKGEYYKQKADMYLGELNKLIISSPSPKGQGGGCLPYATMENADTGHGWSTPHGASTCSIAGTAYMILAVKAYNPLMLKK